MPRLLIQSRTTGRFLVPSPADNQPIWIRDLKKAGTGVVDDMENCIQMIEEYADFDDFCQVIDLDRLGTPNDYV